MHVERLPDVRVTRARAPGHQLGLRATGGLGPQAGAARRGIHARRVEEVLEADAGLPARVLRLRDVCI